MGDARGCDAEGDRRLHDRRPVAVAVRVHGGTGTEALCQTRDVSVGGLCLAVPKEGPNWAIGDTIGLEVHVPGRTPAHVEAEVRWIAGTLFGVMFRTGAVAALAAFLTALGGTMTAFAATSTVPEFDPNADVVLDMEGGSERPDEYLVLQAFERQFSAFDRCVEAAKQGEDVRLPGEVEVEVLLNPKGNRPLGVNAQLSSQLKQQQQLRDCLRTAVAEAKYPAYEGPPVVVDFSFELDPGTVWVEE